MAVVTILRTGKTRDMLLAKIARNIFTLAATLDILLRFTHIAGVENKIADILSKWEGTEENQRVLNTLPYKVHWVDILPQHYILNDNV